MWFLRLIATAASLAALVVALPHPSDGPEHEVHVFKRGEPLTPEDLALAEMHEVNTTESIYPTLTSLLLRSERSCV